MTAPRWRTWLALAATVAAAIVLGSQAPALLRPAHGPAREGDFRVHVAGQAAPLTLYGSTTCPYCAQARAYLRGAGIAFNDRVIDVSPEAAALYQRLGEHSVPVLVAQDRLVVGFNQRRYAALVAAGRLTTYKETP